MDNEKEGRRKQVERCLAILFTATNGPDELFKEALDAYIKGKIRLSELEKRVDRLEYTKNDRESGAKEQYQISKSEYELFKEKHRINRE